MNSVEDNSGIDWQNKIAEWLKNGDIWSDGDIILCRTEYIANTLADMFEILYREQGDEDMKMITEYFDPLEDERDDDVDEYTGWWSVY